MNGYVHSFQSMGAVDGPGLRFIIFMQGCPLRCIYCHNPDTWNFNVGETFTAEQVVEKAIRFKPYFKNTGGVTVSGGEALFQWEFVKELFELLHKNNISTCLDTSGICDLTSAKQVLEHTDLVICDIKFATDNEYIKNCNGKLQKVLDFLNLTEKMNVPVWIRHVVVPNLTDKKEYILSIKSLAEGYSNVKKIELLPFKKLCETKYKELGIDFPLSNTPECTKEQIFQLSKFLCK